MRIAVLVKQVPDTSSDRRFENLRLVRGEDDVLNEGDEHAVEAAADLVRTHGGEVVAVMNLLTRLSLLLFLFQISSTNRVSPVLRTSRLLG